MMTIWLRPPLVGRKREDVGLGFVSLFVVMAVLLKKVAVPALGSAIRNGKEKAATPVSRAAKYLNG
jgi:hypothetical protein